MPYIPKEKRHLALVSPANVGELTYVLYYYLQGYWLTGDKRFQQIAEINGAVESAKAEFQRKFQIPYEMEKERENGDV